MKRVILESPYAGDIEKNLEYARRCVKDCLVHGESPLASHLLFTQPHILDDAIPEQRRLGITAGHAWMDVADRVVVYTDLGITAGMKVGIEKARVLGIPILYRSLTNGSTTNE